MLKVEAFIYNGCNGSQPAGDYNTQEGFKNQAFSGSGRIVINEKVKASGRIPKKDESKKFIQNEA